MENIIFFGFLTQHIEFVSFFLYICTLVQMDLLTSHHQLNLIYGQFLKPLLCIIDLNLNSLPWFTFFGVQII